MGSMSCIWSDLNAPGTKTPLSHSILKLGEFPFPLLALWVIRIALPIWKWKSWKSSITKWAQWAAYGLFWMPQALKPLCLIHIGSCKNSPFPLLALWAYPSTGGGKHKDFGTQHRRESNQYPFVGGKIWQFSSIMVQLKCVRTLHFLCLVPFMYKTSLKHVKSNVKPLLLNFYVYY